MSCCPALSWRAAAALVISAALFAQDVPTDKVNVKVVNVLATVRDKKGKIVNDLSQSDFTLDEDGRPQTIKYFSRETNTPLTLGLLVDTSMSLRNNIDSERSASGTFVESVLRENTDTAFLIHFDQEIELLQDLTKSPQKINSALNDLHTATPQDQDNAGGNNGGSNGGDPNGGGYPGGGRGGRSNHGGGTHLYDAIFLASDELMSKQPGRKAIVLLTDGQDRGSKESIESAIESAQRANTIVYSIYFLGEEGRGSGGDRDGGGGGHRRGGIGLPGGGWPGGGGGGWPGGGGGGGWPGGGGGGPRQGGGREPHEPRVDGKKILERISRETGGRMFEVSKKESVGDIYQQIQDELRNQYNIGYTSDQQGNEYRKITVKTKQSDLIVQARDGYYPSKQMDAKGGE